MAYRNPADGLAARRKRYNTERRQRQQRYERERRELITRLGGCCHACGSRDFSRLEFDHPNGRPYNPAKLSRLSRLRLYREEAKQGKVRLLCRTCNAQDGGHKRTKYCP